MSDVSRETSEQLRRYATLLVEENDRQNLVAKSTIDDLWRRHIDDAAQLIGYGPRSGTWLDIGSGAGLPGIVIAILTGSQMILVEPRRLRADFLQRVVDDLSLNATVIRSKAESVDCPPVDVITARAVASIDRLFAISLHLSHRGTRWILPKGKSAHLELEDAIKTWQGDFRLEASRTDPDAHILIASNIRRKSRARGVA
ncbi:MAG: 16S rRNA (guanine(527)-N(7))-methyltransferase RsmG [Pseudomonadota bacterium]